MSAEHEVALRSLWREIAEKRIEADSKRRQSPQSLALAVVVRRQIRELGLELVEIGEQGEDDPGPVNPPTWRVSERTMHG